MQSFLAFCECGGLLKYVYKQSSIIEKNAAEVYLRFDHLICVARCLKSSTAIHWIQLVLLSLGPMHVDWFGGTISQKCCVNSLNSSAEVKTDVSHNNSHKVYTHIRIVGSFGLIVCFVYGCAHILFASTKWQYWHIIILFWLHDCKGCISGELYVTISVQTIFYRKTRRKYHKRYILFRSLSLSLSLHVIHGIF